MSSVGVAPVTVLPGRPRDLGDGFMVRRVLPHGRRQMVGPFIFFDEMGPARLAPGQGLDVRPHPHIGLATVTYLFEGSIRHRDSLGTLQDIRPGDVNWMTAGRGIVHSERSPPEARAAGASVWGLQSWIALPRAAEEAEPAFVHHAAATLPRFASGDADLCLIAGTAFGHRSPVAVHSPLFYLDARLPAGGTLELPAEHAERAVYVAVGDVDVGGVACEPGQLAVLAPGASVRLASAAGTRCMLLGGEALEGPRHLWWNFVSSSLERIERAKRDWQAYGRAPFPAVPGETEYIPLPE